MRIALALTLDATMNQGYAYGVVVTLLLWAASFGALGISHSAQTIRVAVKCWSISTLSALVAAMAFGYFYTVRMQGVTGVIAHLPGIVQLFTAAGSAAVGLAIWYASRRGAYLAEMERRADPASQVGERS